MATWTDIDDSRLEPGKPIRSVDGLALRDNPIAIAEGAEGAPKVEVFEQVFTASGVFVAPKAGRYFVDLVGGGGGGSNGGPNAFGVGGSRGAWVRETVVLSAGQSVPVVVGGSATASSFGALTAPAGTGAGAQEGKQGRDGVFGNVNAANGSTQYASNPGGVGGRGYGAGGGGGGAGNGSSGTGAVGGAGAQGIVMVRW